MSTDNPWAEESLKAQRKFVDAWSEMARSGGATTNTPHSDLWRQGFEQWSNACGTTSAQPDIDTALAKCVAMGKEYFAMAEQVSKKLATGSSPAEAVEGWVAELTQSLQRMGQMPGFDGAAVSDFLKQWFSPASQW